MTQGSQQGLHTRQTRWPAAGLPWLLALSMAAADAAAAQANQPPTVDPSRVADLRWLAGCWEMRRGARVTLEQWMAPAGGAMLGMSRTVQGESLREWEHLLIGPHDGRLAYTARPARQAETVFPATFLSDTLLRFENPAHDFPQRIVYRRVGRDSLVATVSAIQEGRERAIPFPMRRVTCGE